MSNRRWQRWRSAAYLLLIAIAIVLVVMYWSILVAIWREQALTLAVAAALMVCGTLVQARNFLVFLDVPNGLRVWSFSRVWALSALANYVAPLQPGIAVRVAWLARNNIGIGASLLATWRQLIASVWVSLAGLAIGIALTGNLSSRWPAVVLALVWLALFAFRRLWLGWLDRLQRPSWLTRSKDVLHRAATGMPLNGITGVAIQYALGTMMLYWVYSRFGAEIDIGEALILACLIYVSSIVAVLPGNLGVMEAIYMLGGHGLGLSAAQAGALALLLRVAHVLGNGVLAMCGIASPGLFRER